MFDILSIPSLCSKCAHEAVCQFQKDYYSLRASTDNILKSIKNGKFRISIQCDHYRLNMPVCREPKEE